MVAETEDQQEMKNIFISTPGKVEHHQFEEIPLTDIVINKLVPPDDLLKSTPSITSIPEMQFIQDDGSPVPGITIKPSVSNSVKHLKWKAFRQVLYCLIRNILCWLFLGSSIIIMIHGSEVKDWLDDERVCIIVLCALGAVGLPFQATYIACEMKNIRPSLVAWMLRHAQNMTDFQKVIQERQKSPPYLAIEISVRSGGLIKNKSDDSNHWLRTSRKNIRNLDIHSWSDKSKPVSEVHWDNFNCFWILLSKEYRFMDEVVKESTQKDVADFKEQCEFDKFMYFMKFQYVLDVQEGDYFPDAQGCMVYKDKKPRFYNWNVYKCFLLASLDVVYQLIFYCITKKIDDYYFVKLIDR